MYFGRFYRRRNFCMLSAVLTSLVSPTLAIWPFPPKRFTGNSLIGAGSLGLSGEGRVVAFGDFNGDQSLDMVVLENDQQTLTVYYWIHESFSFIASGSFKHPRNVLNVVPGDFTHSGKLDLLIMSQSQTNGQLDLTLYPALIDDGFDVTHSLILPPSFLSQPIPMDVNGDLKIDLLGITPSSAGSGATYQVWKNVWNASSSDPTLFEIIESGFQGRQCSIANPHSNAVVDLDGDCLADIFLLCDDGKGGKTYQIWVNKKADGFSLSQEGALPAGVQAISFIDMDRDGTIDLVFPTCSSVSQSTGVGSDCYINIAYNQQLGLCTSSTDSGMKKGVRQCRPPGDLCSADPNFKFNMSDSPDNKAFVRFPVSSLFPSSPSLLVLDTTFNPHLSIPLKFGDVNLDGFPDLLTISVSGRDHIPQLAYSVPCLAGVVGCPADGSGKRGWKLVTNGAETLNAVKDARSVAFLDLNEDGTLDIMVQRSGIAGHGNYLFIHNNFYYDAFFLKAIVLNGACNSGWCLSPNGSELYPPFGVSYSGATFKYTVLDTAGRRSAAQVGQLPQTSYHALQTPYSFFGLGRTNNYIENLFVGTTIHAPEHFIDMEGVIPNSKVVILPSAKEGEAWKRELFLRPGEWIPWVTVIVVAGTFLLAIIVFVLHLNEKREDELERRRASHHINFDAL